MHLFRLFPSLTNLILCILLNIFIYICIYFFLCKKKCIFLYKKLGGKKKMCNFVKTLKFTIYGSYINYWNERWLWKNHYFNYPR